MEQESKECLKRILMVKKVKGVHIENGTIIYFPSLAEASRNGYHHVYDVIKGNRNHCKKYKWYYV